MANTTRLGSRTTGTAASAIVPLPRLALMRISVFGCGYLGAVHAACMASLGHEVVGVDVVLEEQVAALAAGRPPFHEPGLERAAGRGARPPAGWSSPPTRRGRRGATCTSSASARRRSATRTPRTCPTSARRSTASCRCCGPGDVVVGQVDGAGRDGGGDRGADGRAGAGCGAGVEPGVPARGTRGRGHAAPGPVGLRASVRATAARGRRLSWTRCTPRRWPTGTPKIETDLATAQLVKVAANSFLATKISFINAMAELCEATGADVTQLADAIGHDARIGRKFLNAGVGFGGGCLPKDIRAFMARAGELGVDQALTFLREVDSINMRRRVRMVDLAREVCGGSIVGRRIAVLGAAFKPHSDDVRDSPALSVAAQMQLQGAQVVVTDPRGHRQRAQEVARARLRRHRRGGGPRRRGGAAAHRVAGVRRPRPGRRSRTRSPSRGWSTGATASTRPRGARPAGPTARSAGPEALSRPAPCWPASRS